MKRVIAIAGDTIEIRRRKVYLNWHVIEEPYTAELVNYEIEFMTIPQKPCLFWEIIVTIVLILILGVFCPKVISLVKSIKFTGPSIVSSLCYDGDDWGNFDPSSSS
ncbi:leader peptidase I [Microcystis aeruginosa NIES-3807]|uniref:Leader peptidase I n=1 Tax=Microcystis aeruginosa NIES-3807 TaxID=2517785 RepID=A0AAD3B217_MICAE|nr:leader peptidase I [Microcystis aeruginosa NIES-3807]